MIPEFSLNSLVEGFLPHHEGGTKVIKGVRSNYHDSV